MERPLSVQRWNVPTRPRNCSVDAAGRHPTRKTTGREHVSLMRLFVTHFSGSQDLPFESGWETIIRELTATSAAATFSSSPVWQYVAARTCSPSPSVCSSVAVISSVDTVLFAKQLLFRCPRALCERSITPDLATHRCSRRRLFSGLLSLLPGNLSCVNLGSLQLRWNGPHKTVVKVTKGRPGGEKTVCTDGCRQTAVFTWTESSEITCTLDQRCEIELDTPLRVLALEPLNKTQRQ